MTKTPGRSGILLVDKPGGMTSHDVVSRTRKLAGTRKVGHAGTLDPMATGLLVLGINGATRLLTYLVGLDKEYEATIRLGASTPTDDADSSADVVANAEDIAGITESSVGEAIVNLTGEISQVPSAVSAIKVDGRRAYERVRAGERVELSPRRVTIQSFEVLAARRHDFVDLDVRIQCTTGTYVRALARDLGAALGVGGHLTVLRRTRVGPFGVADSVALDDVDVARDLRSPAGIARSLFPVLELSPQQSVDLGHGKKIAAGSLLAGPKVRRAATSDSRHKLPREPVAAIDQDGRLIGLVTISGDQATSLINFPSEEAAS